MSKYTTELRYLIEEQVDLGLDQYPIFDESYRSTLNAKIVSNFYFREIGFETVGLFLNRLHNKLNLIMPYYNQLYKSAQLEFDPLSNYKFDEYYDGSTSRNGTQGEDTSRNINTSSESNSTLNGTSDTKGTTSGTQTIKGKDTTTSKQIGSDTPQGMLSAASLGENATWASNAQFGNTDLEQDSNNTTSGTEENKNTSSSTGKDESTGSTEDTYTQSAHQQEDGTQVYHKSLEGYSGISPSNLIMEYRKTLINIDLMVIGELEELFMGVW